MRNTNKSTLHKHKYDLNLIEQFEILESFLDDFSFLVFGRDIIKCKNYVLSLKTILHSSKATLGNVVECCKCFCLADAYTLLRKYRDDLFFYLYLVTYDVNIKSGITKSTSRIETNIEQWCKNCMSNLKISEVLATIASSDNLKDAIREYGLQKSFEKIGKILNNYTHGNGYSFYNSSACILNEIDLKKRMNDVVFTARYITTTFLLLLTLCSPQYIMSMDYIDQFELGQTSSECSHCWVAPFVVDFFRNNLEIIDKNCYEYLKEKTCMEI